jgi:hypothetical protein
MNNPKLLRHLRSLEVELHQPSVRADAGGLNELLHDEFLEFGRSGARFTKADILRSLPLERSPSRVWSEAYQLAILADGVALLTYRTAHADETGSLSRHTLRSSIWVRTPDGWQVRFHQGTPTEAFRERTTRSGLGREFWMTS